MSLQICCEPELAAAKEFAIKTGGQIGRGLLDQLNSQLRYLANYSNGEGCIHDVAEGKDTKCDLHPDLAPHSFSFVMFKREGPTKPWMFWFNGGLIYQGPDQPADGSAPSFTVSVGTEMKTGWFVHT